MPAESFKPRQRMQLAKPKGREQLGSTVDFKEVFFQCDDSDQGFKLFIRHGYDGRVAPLVLNIDLLNSLGNPLETVTNAKDHIKKNLRALVVVRSKARLTGRFTIHPDNKVRGILTLFLDDIWLGNCDVGISIHDNRDQGAYSYVDFLIDQEGRPFILKGYASSD